MSEEQKFSDEISFHCRSPIYMCPSCTHAVNCQDLLNILRIFKMEVKDKEIDYITNFPFLKERDFNVDERNKMNEMSSGEWLTFTRTAFSSRFPHILGHDLRRRHPDYKSPNLMGLLIAFFTRQGEQVLDPFAGTGTSLIASTLLGREAVGFEINREWIDIYYEICKKENLSRQKLVQGNCLELTEYVPPDSVDFIILDPPDPMNSKEWYGKKIEGSPFEAFFQFVNTIFQNCYRGLKNRSYLAAFTRNMYQKGRYLFLTPHFAAAAEDAGFIIKGEKIWENVGEKLRPYGYPHSYVPNIVHHDILIFQKREEESAEDDEA